MNPARTTGAGFLRTWGWTITTYHQGRHRRLAEHVVDAFIGTAAGLVLIAAIWLISLLFTLPR